MKKYLVPFVCIILLSTQVWADKGGVFIEPMVTYERGEGEINWPSPFNSSDTDFQGFGIGARLGIHLFESVFLAADGRYSMLKYEDSSADQKTEANVWNYGPVLGFQMPTTLGLRVWASYIIDGQMDPDEDNGFDPKFEDGTGYRLGAGIKLGITSLNLEYQNIKYDNIELDKIGGLGTNISGDVEHKTNSWILSVSFPISI